MAGPEERSDATTGAPADPSIVGMGLQEGRGRTNGHSRGLGLGLFIARQIARAHDGGVEVASGEAIGTNFTVRLPDRR